MSIKMIMSCFHFGHYAIRANIEGMNHELSLITSGQGENSFNWILGHIVWERNMVMKILGFEPETSDTFNSLYQRGSKILDPSKAFAFDRLEEMLDATQEKLELPEVEEKLEQLNEKDLEIVKFLGWHELYHTGQLGIMRRIAGLEGVIK